MNTQIGPLYDLPIPDNVRGFFDPLKTRKWVNENAVSSFKKALNKVESNAYRLKVSNIELHEPAKPYTYAEQNKAMMDKKDLTIPLKGKVQLIDKKTGAVVDEKSTTIAHIPWVTERNTVILNGSEYSHCFHGSTFVWTENGMQRIEDIVNKEKNIRVWSYNFNTKEFELKPIVSWMKNKIIQPMSEVTFKANGRLPVAASKFNPTTIWGTKTHNFYSNDGTKTELQNIKEVTLVREKLSYIQKQVVLGSFLGDAHIQKGGIFRETHCAKQLEYLKFKHQILGPFCADTGITECKAKHKSYCFHTKAHSYFWQLREKYYKNCIKTFDQELLDQVDELGLAIFYFDDGTLARQKNGNCISVILCTNWFTKEELELMLCWFNKKWGLTGRIEHKPTEFSHRAINQGRNNMLAFDSTSSRKFLDLIAPYALDIFRYKFGSTRPITGFCTSCNKETDLQTKLCSECYINKAQTDLVWYNKYGSGKRLGGRQAIKLLKAENFKTEPTMALWWDEVQTKYGTKLIDITQSQPITYELFSVPCNVDNSTKKWYSTHRTVYDIEVADNHNYFANGALVSNCSQARLKPGVYSRIKESGEAEAHVNVQAGSGMGGKVIFYPDRALFIYQVGTTQIKLYGLLRDLGVSDSEMEAAWGKEILLKNKKEYSGNEVEKMYTKVFGHREE
ncbi:hypothetical protein CCP3SC5AM1_880011 [Gammaproteobacteria bacterium]